MSYTSPSNINHFHLIVLPFPYLPWWYGGHSQIELVSGPGPCSRCAGRIVAAVVCSVKVLSNAVVGSTLEETRTTWVTVTITLTQLKWKSTIGSVITCAGIQSKNLLHILDCHSSCHPRHKVSWQAAWEGWNLKDIRHMVNWPWCQL